MPIKPQETLPLTATPRPEISRLDRLSPGPWYECNRRRSEQHNLVSCMFPGSAATRYGNTSRLGLVIQKMAFSDSFLPPTHGWNLEIQFLSVQIVGSQLEGITRVSVKSSTSQTALKYASQNAPSSQS